MSMVIPVKGTKYRYIALRIAQEIAFSTMTRVVGGSVLPTDVIQTQGPYGNQLILIL
jgi:hypothetical protein